MKRILMISAITCMLFTACSNEPKKEDGTKSIAVDTTTTVGTALTEVDSTKAATDTVALDSAQAAHGHAH